MCISSFLPATDKFEFSHQLFAKGYPYYYVEKVYLNYFKELKGYANQQVENYCQ